MNQIGRYKLLNVLGRGGMGTVHLAEDPTGQRVAVKVINPELSQHEQFRMRFRREADAAQRVRRFCTAAVLDAALDGDQLYVVTEYVPGPNLEEAVRDSGPLRGSSLDALAVSVATALTAIHSAGVVHRDLKPSNVLLSPVGPRVIDFGIARALDSLGGVTGTGELVGTPRYMAPEVLRGEPISAACDVFSWGCLIAFAASGRAPFGGDALPSIIYQVLNAEPVLSELEPGLRELVVAALDKDPARRPTAQQLLDHLIGRSAPPEQAIHTVQVAWQQGTTPMGPAQPYGQAQPYGTSGPQPTRVEQGRQRRGGKGKLVAGLAAAVALVVGGGAGLWVLLSGGGPPTHLPALFQDDFNNTSSGWSGTYDAAADRSYGYTTDGAYGLDAGEGTEEAWATAPIPFVPAAPPTPDPAATPTPITPAKLLIGVDATIRSSRGNGEYGIWCRGNGDGTYYDFTMDTAGNARIRRVVDKAGGNLAPPVLLDKPKTGQKVRLEASCEQVDKAVRLILWVDGKRVLDLEDPNGLKNGSIGLFSRVSRGSKSSMKVTYDNFEMRGQQPTK